MKIKGITLYNFRQFKGLQNIKFSIDPDKNVTVIVGDNGAGKTTLLESILWCFHNKLNLPNSDQILNASVAKNMDLGEEEDAYVEINFTVNNDEDNKKNNEIEYFAKRKEKFIKLDSMVTREKNSRIFELKMKREDGTEKLVEGRPDETIKKIIPENIAKYFFFDGERIENLSKFNNKGKRDIKEAVRKILGLDVIEDSRKHIEKSIKLFECEYKTNNKFEQDKINTEKFDCENNIQEDKELSAQLNLDLNNQDDKKQDIESKLRMNYASKDLQERRDQIDIDKVDKERDLEILKKEMSDLIKMYFPQFLIYKLLEISNKKFDLSKLESKGVPGLDSQAIDYLIERGQCICGNKLTIDSECYDKLLRLKGFQPPASLGTIINQFKEKTYDITNNGNIFIEHYGKKYIKKEDILSKIDDLNEELDKISEKLKGTSNVKLLEEEKSCCESEIIKINIRINVLDKRIKENEEKLIGLKNQLLTIILNDERNNLIGKRITYAKNVLDEFKKYFKKKEDIIKSKLQGSVSSILEKMINTKHKLEINDDYSFEVYDQNGINSTSSGQDVVISFAIIGGLVNIALEDHSDFDKTQNYPLILDAPFAKLSKSHRKNVSELATDLAEQFILFTVDSQYENDVEGFLKNKIYKEYVLLTHDDNDEKFTEIRPGGVTNV